MMEIVIALMLFEIVAAGLVGLLTSATAATNLARQRTLAQQAALNQIETVRALDYGSVGIVGGNPPGTVASTANINPGGLTATVTTEISYVDDPTPLGYTTHTNYKKVVVTVRRSRDSKTLAKEVTYVAPEQKPSTGTATIDAEVVDYGDNTPVTGAGLGLQTGPSAPRSDTTDEAGKATFAGLQPNPTSGSQAYYDLVVTPPAGYAALADTVSPSGAAHVQLAPTQYWPTVLYLYRPATIYVQLLNADGTTYAGAASVTVKYTRNATQYTQTFSYAGTALTVTSINGVPLIPKVDYTVSVSGTGFYPNPPSSTPATANVPNAYPTDLTSTFAFTDAQLAAAVNVTVKGTNGIACKNAGVTVSGGPWSVSLAGVTGATGTPAVYAGTVPVGSSYTVRGTYGTHSGQLVTQSIAAGTNTFVVTLGSGTC